MRSRSLLLVSTLCSAPAALAQINVTVDWGTPTGVQASPFAYGSDVPSAFGDNGDPSYQSNMAYAHPGLVRYWGAPLTDPAQGWLNNDLQTWNQSTIQQQLGALSWGPTVMLTLGGWPPAWSDSDGTLDSSHYTDFANLCASLVQVVNGTLGLGVPYWELFNEPGEYDGNGATLGNIANQAAAAMKAVDPTIKVGGAAWSYDLEPGMTDFITTTAGTLDFQSWHGYPVEDPSSPDSQVFGSTNYGAPDTGAQQTIQDIQAATGYPTETFFDEYNVNGSCWQPYDPRCTNNVGMVYAAMQIVSMVNAGVTGTAHWDDADGTYGLMDASPDYSMFPSAHLLHVLNGSFIGQVVATTSSDDTTVVAYAVSQGGTQALLLVNQDENGSDTVNLSFSGWATAPTQLQVQQVTSSGLATSTLNYADAQSGLSLPPLSATALVVVTGQPTPDGGVEPTSGTTGTTTGRTAATGTSAGTSGSAGGTSGGTGASGNCAILMATGAGEITDGQGNVWTIAAGVVQENGAKAGYSANVVEVADVGGSIYQENNQQGWWVWSGGTWADSSDPTAGCASGASSGDTSPTSNNTSSSSGGAHGSTGGGRTEGATGTTGGAAGGASTGAGATSGGGKGASTGAGTTSGGGKGASTGAGAPDAGVNALPSSGGCGCESLGADPLPLLGWGLAALVGLRRRRRESH